MRLCILNYDVYWTDCEDKHKSESAIAVKKTISHACFGLPPFLIIEATGACVPTGNTGMFLAAVYKSLKRLWNDTSQNY
jgi:hypothetical protein